MAEILIPSKVRIFQDKISTEYSKLDLSPVDVPLRYDLS